MTWINILTLIGAIGLFFYGLKLMSEGLQKIMGESLRSILAAMTRNRFTGMLTGVLVTSLVQSSSATTVMVVSFVNAGMITLAEAMAVIMGANLGTTATTWLIATLGFKFPIALFAFPIIALSWPYLISKHSKHNSWGELFLGFALLFFGLEELKQSIPDLSVYPAVPDFLHQYVNAGFVPVIVLLLLGILLTVVFQASCITFTIASLMCINSWIPFEMGCAMVLGSNIGTCLSPLLAARSANTMARRAALGHLLFNLVGTIWALSLFFYFCHFIANLCISIGLGNPQNVEDVALGLTMFHTLFNVITLCLMLPFTSTFVAAVSRLIPEQKQGDDSFKLQHISEGYLASSGEMALVQVHKETSLYGEDVYKMFKMVLQMLNEPMGSDKQLELMRKVKLLEEESDKAELEIAQFLNQISPSTLSFSGEQHSRSLYKVVDELESIADSIYHCSVSLSQKCDQRVWFTPEMNKDLSKMMSLIDSAMQHMLKVLEMDNVPDNALNKAYNFEDEINNLRNQLRNSMLDSIERKDFEFQQNTYFMHLINECEKIGDYIINVISASSEK